MPCIGACEVTDMCYIMPAVTGFVESLGVSYVTLVNMYRYMC